MRAGYPSMGLLAIPGIVFLSCIPSGISGSKAFFLTRVFTHSLRHTIYPNNFKTDKNKHFKLGKLDLHMFKVI